MVLTGDSDAFRRLGGLEGSGDAHRDEVTQTHEAHLGRAEAHAASQVRCSEREREREEREPRCHLGVKPFLAEHV